MVGKDETPPVSPPTVFSGNLPEQNELSSCQWFLTDNKFCNKVKKSVACKGNETDCPFCK